MPPSDLACAIAPACARSAFAAAAFCGALVEAPDLRTASATAGAFIWTKYRSSCRARTAAGRKLSGSAELLAKRALCPASNLCGADCPVVCTANTSTKPNTSANERRRRTVPLPIVTDLRILAGRAVDWQLPLPHQGRRPDTFRMPRAIAAHDGPSAQLGRPDRVTASCGILSSRDERADDGGERGRTGAVQRGVPGRDRAAGKRRLRRRPDRLERDDRPPTGDRRALRGRG